MVEILLGVSLTANVGLLAWLAREVYTIRIMMENFSGRLSAVEALTNPRKKRT